MILESAGGYVEVETHQGVTTIGFSHPKGNSLPSKLLGELAQQIHAAGLDDSSRVIVLRSSGTGAFCGGASLDELLTLDTEANATAFFKGFADVFDAIRTSSRLVVARVQGNCVGGGVGLAAAADYCIAWEDVSIKLSELSIGLAPLVIAPVLERKIGLAAFSQLAIDATMWRNADWAKRKGLFCEVHPSIENMDESVSRLANTLAHTSRSSIAALKSVLWKDTENWSKLLMESAAASGKLALSADAKSALRAMRTPTEKQL